MLEIVRNIGDVLGLGDPRFGESSSLVGLRRGMIELEDAEIAGRLETVGEGVETGAEHDDLPQPLLDRGPRRILGKAAAHGDEEAQGPTLRPLPAKRDGFIRVRPEDGERERIGEDEPMFENLVRRPVSRRADRRSARLSVLHGARVGAAGRSVERELDAGNPFPYRPANL